MLSKNLKDELTTFIQKRSLNYLYLINNDDIFCKFLMKLIKTEISNPKESLFKEGDYSTKLYLIDKGSVIIFDETTGLIYKKLHVNFHFMSSLKFKGKHKLWRNWFLFTKEKTYKCRFNYVC